MKTRTKNNKQTHERRLSVKVFEVNEHFFSILLDSSLCRCVGGSGEQFVSCISMDI